LRKPEVRRRQSEESLKGEKGEGSEKLRNCVKNHEPVSGVRWCKRRDRFQLDLQPLRKGKRNEKNGKLACSANLHTHFQLYRKERRGGGREMTGGEEGLILEERLGQDEKRDFPFREQNKLSSSTYL